MSPGLKFQHLMIPILLGASVEMAKGQAPTPYEAPNLKTVLFAGYSSVNLKPGQGLDRITLNGWTTSVTSYHFFERWGLTAELSGNGGDGNSQRAYLFGGTFRAVQRKRIDLTGRILAGGTRWEPNAQGLGAYRQQTGLTFGFGQSIDFKFNESFAVRLQPDLRFVRLQDASGASKTVLDRPLSVGLVYQFGRR